MTAKDTLIKKLGSEEAYIAFMKQIAAKGGKKSRGGYWYNNSKLAKENAQKGGSRSRRGRTFLREENGQYIYRNLKTNEIETYPVDK